MERAFVKMHGLGNDFVVFDARTAPLALAPERARAVADRRTGVGCDQILVLEASATADAFMRVRNADGGGAAACGNGARCAAALLMAESGRTEATLETAAGAVAARAEADGRVTVDMGEPRLDWRDIPLAEPRDTLHIGLAADPLRDAAAVDMGNPHAVFFVADADAVDIETLGPRLETDPLFPERANIEAVSVAGPGALRMRVWERGVGVTPACGTGACAALVAAHRRGLCGRCAVVRLDGGDLEVAWGADGRVRMTGPAAVSFRGALDGGLLA